MEVTEEFKKQLAEKVKRQLELEQEVSEERIREKTSEVLDLLLQGEYITVSERIDIVNWVLNQVKRLGVLQPLLDDKDITEIMINGPERIFVEKAGRLYQSTERFESNKQLEDIIQKIVAKVNRTVDSLNPICDARLEDGSRVNIVLPPIALNGATVTIRKFPEKVISFEDLVSWGAITTEAADEILKEIEKLDL